LTNQIIYSEAGTHNGIFCIGDCRRKIESQDYYSDDDVSAINSDSDIVVTVEKADFVEFWDNDSSTLAWFEEELST
jgi:hypothetical protein